MLTSIEGTYRDGQIVLRETPLQVPNDTPVIVTFIGSGEIGLRERGITRSQAAELRASLASFEDWNAPEMDAYDDYDDAKTNL